jgi:transketolase N-terminal domain/subunit
MPDLPDDLARVFARGGHPGGSASSLRILRAFRSEFRPTDLILSSKGHDAAAFLVDGMERGHIDPCERDYYRSVNGYPGHPERGMTPGALVSTGSLGMGLSKAVGIAFSRQDSRVFCIVGDGETQEGQVWEALQFASRYDLSNLIVFLDHNGAQSDNRPLPRPNILQPEAIFKAAGWAVYIADLDHPGLPATEGPLCVLVHGEKTLPHALSQPGPLVLAYGKALRASLEADPALIVLEADLALDHGLAGLADAFPGRVLACGISEQHMVSCAVGLAAAGWHPICHTFERFYLRAAEQILDALQEPGLVIRFVGGLAGLLPQGPGRSHELPEHQRQALFPIQTYAPLTPDEVAPCVASMLRQPRSTYLRLLAQPELGG